MVALSVQGSGVPGRSEEARRENLSCLRAWSSAGSSMTATARTGAAKATIWRRRLKLGAHEHQHPGVAPAVCFEPMLTSTGDTGIGN